MLCECVSSPQMTRVLQPVDATADRFYNYDFRHLPIDDILLYVNGEMEKTVLIARHLK